MDSYPVQLDIDGAYYRIQRNDKWCSVCLSDMTQGERKELLRNMNFDEISRAIDHLVYILRLEGSRA